MNLKDQRVIYVYEKQEGLIQILENVFFLNWKYITTQITGAFVKANTSS